MDKQISEEIAALGGDVSQPEWQWFLNNGPHGNNFTWGQTKKEPAGYVGVEHLQEIIDEKIGQDSQFLNKAKKVVDIALHSNSINLIRRGIQVASVIGELEELALVGALTNHANQEITKDAKACVFVLKRKLRHG